MSSRGGALVALAFLVVLTLGAGGCSASTDRGESSNPTEIPPPATATTVRHLAARAFAEAIKDLDTVAVDVRTAGEFRAGHIPGAENFDVQSSEFTVRLAALDRTAGYALYCRSGRRSADAAEKMLAAGFTHVMDLAGGTDAWSAAGNPLVAAA